MFMICTNLQALVVVKVCIGLALVLEGMQVRLQRVRLQQLCKQVAICKVLNMQEMSPTVLEAPLLKPVLLMLLGTACLAPYLSLPAPSCGTGCPHPPATAPAHPWPMIDC
jgi:hypothetical protein